ncbi:MAG: phosphoribosylaminoimidazolesuccinocarboxamide synthase [candidate division Zixibacteria bacterium]|nr:phosphoribosylaminoimidazolesuccinocarboxamide synthase [candidate division Zixibacteria bacterium]NIR63256.1 phosphoribosylaminoimidazolesuccinocarboxamide synthase [candidate division Zixibacteria bacterium]NIS17116.1 phosphoribosylaminoimidazolesuccinocarboxamide synthase [candidate division Zixibacteria bacterium]NIS45237.1 phosphoribosylaminoimidazolesuccinocarboxamide synthase [candidate division Zixibacteria bacterium]NIT53468.1 phosphoribosylaminoimidazolesuccinocarboxamide synthase 
MADTLQTVYRTEISEFPKFADGKVRDVYDLGDKLLVVATDRLSAFDVVLPNPIPQKGEVLTKMSVFWFDYLSDVVPNHFITANIDEYPHELQKHADILKNRSMLVKKCKRIDFECIVRGYITGSMWKEYQKAKSKDSKKVLHGFVLPDDLEESEKFPRPLFTPSTKAESGHDENISQQEMSDSLGRDLVQRLEEVSIKLFEKASNYAESRGIIIADTKFEFGFDGDELTLIDEVLSPDSSRFWPKYKYAKGRSQESFDKQFIRDYLTKAGWNKKPPAPEIPDDIIEKTSQKYKEAYELLIE